VTTWFDRYRVEDHLARRSDAQALWLTGQSSFAHSRLSPGQLAILDDLVTVGYEPVRCGFPYNSGALARPYRKEPLPPVCARNLGQYLAARWSSHFAQVVARHLQPVFDVTSRHLLLLLGSCGAELFTAARPLLRVPDGLAVHVLAVGPVGRLPEEPAPYVLRGRYDLLSLVWSRAPGLPVPCGHMGYVDRSEVRAEILRHARQTLG
jgi:hypothetical protein